MIAWNDVQATLKPGEYAVEIVRTDYYIKPGGRIQYIIPH